MTADPSRLVEDVIESTHSLQRSIAGLTEEQARGDSLLPGWTRGHVVTHIARNADALTNLFTWARTGVETPMYPSREIRNQTIEEQSSRSPAEMIEDVDAAHQRFLTAAYEMSPDDWQAKISWGAAGREGPATAVPWLRRMEVEVHHVDLDLDYTLAHWPEDFVEKLLAETVRDFSAREDMEPFTLVGNEDQGRWDVAGGGREINGPPPALLGWLLGRSEGLALHTDGSLPTVGAWR
jgi:maleylpyruvate isomerase